MVCVKYSYRDIRWEWDNPRKERDNMTNVNEMYAGKYLKAADLGNNSHTVIIERVTQEELGMDKKKEWILYFRGKDKAMVCNATNGFVIAAIHGDENEGWVGKEITIYSKPNCYQGKPGIRVKEETVVPPAADPDEDIPF